MLNNELFPEPFAYSFTQTNTGKEKKFRGSQLQQYPGRNNFKLYLRALTQKYTLDRNNRQTAVTNTTKQRML